MTYWELTLEVMSSLELDRTIISLSHHDTISFQMFRVEYLMSYTDFSVAMGLVDVEYIRIESCSKLHVDLLDHLSADLAWTQTLQGRERYLCGTSKVSTLGGVAFRYLHAVLSWTLTRRGDNTGVVNLLDLYFLWSMVAW